MHIYRKHLHCYIWQIFSFLNKGEGCVTETGSWQWQVLSVYLSFVSFRWQFWQYLWQRCLLSTSYDETEWTPGKPFCVGGTNTVKHAYYKVRFCFVILSVISYIYQVYNMQLTHRNQNHSAVSISSFIIRLCLL